MKKDVSYSKHLTSIEAARKELVRILSEKADYVSSLSTDVTGTSYTIGHARKSISDVMPAERGTVVRLIRKGYIHEYSFNMEDKPEKLAESILKFADDEEKNQKKHSIDNYPTDLLQEEETEFNSVSKAEIGMEDTSAETIIGKLKKISDRGMAASPYVIEAMGRFNMTHVSKLFISSKKTMRQSYLYSEGMISVLIKKDKDVRMNYKGCSILGGSELLDQMDGMVDSVVEGAVEMLGTSPAVPGVYDIITSPEVSGLIAHEAFGHGVEMDMFVKNRAMGRDFINKRVGSEYVNMQEGASAADNTATYGFDDEGIEAHNTTEIDKGILKTGVSDALSAGRLHTEPTGNGRRSNFERKAYARMTNTLFSGGTDTLEDMIRSIDYGYLLEGMQNGMEDPKNWGIQCVLIKGREIKNGRLTGKIISPVIMTGYVPDLLNSISMAAADVSLEGNGFCGKGHKEWLKVSDGGPYLKMKGRLG